MSKLILILTEFPPKFGGMQSHADALCSMLSVEYDIVVYTYKSTELLEEAKLFDQQADYPIKRILSRVSFYSNIKILKKEIANQCPSIVYSSTIFYGILKESFNIPIICRSVGNDILRPWIIYPFQFGSSLLNNMAIEKLFSKIKKTLGKPPAIDILLSRKRKKLASKCANGADIILANSAFTKDAFERININQCEVLVGGVNSKNFAKENKTDENHLRTELNIDKNTFILMTACRFVEKKGLDFLMNAFYKLQEKYPNLELLLIGDGPLKNKLERENQSDKIRFLGKKTKDEIIEYYWIANMFVLCSREVVNSLTGFKDVETMGRVLCEANAASIPVLASNSGGIGSVIQHKYNGLLYETDNYNSFQDNFDLLYNSPSIRSQLIDNGLKAAREKFDWKVIVDEHKNLFRRMAVS